MRSTGIASYTFLFDTHIKTKEIRELIENENIELFQEERNKLQQKAKEAIAEIEKENKKYYNKKRKARNKNKISDLILIKRMQNEDGLNLAVKYFGQYKIKRRQIYRREN